MLGDLFQPETLEQLMACIQEEPSPDSLCQALFAEYDRYFHYENIEQWNKLVSVCEALREPVEAIAEKWINGWPNAADSSSWKSPGILPGRRENAVLAGW